MKNNFKCAHTKLISIDELIPNPKNPNEHPQKQIDLLAKIIKFQGQRAPVVVSVRSGFITKGHARLQAMQKLKWDKVAVDFQDYKTEAEEYADMIADNKIAELAEHNNDKMIKDLADIKFDLDFDLLGIEDFDLNIMNDGGDDSKDDIMPDEKEIDPTCKDGDLWLLGEHRLLCGDSTVKDNVDKLMDGEKADMVFTDPPYGMNLNTDYSSMKHSDKFKKQKKMKDSIDYKPVIGDSESFNPTFILEYFKDIKEIFLWGGDYYCYKLPIENCSWIVWDKRENSDGSNLDKMYGSSFELCWSKTKHKRDIARVIWANCFGTEKEPERRRSGHPTQKPILLAEWFFERYKGQNVIDLFLGSGSTLIACEKTNRKCYGMEIDPHYCDVIIKRWEDFTGNKAKKINV